MIDKKYYILDNVLRINPSKESIEQAKEVTQIVQNNTDDTVVQTWNLYDGHVIDYAFDVTSMKQYVVTAKVPNPKWELRTLFFKSCGVNYTPQTLRRVSIPKRYFTEDGIIDLYYWIL